MNINNSLTNEDEIEINRINKEREANLTIVSADSINRSIKGNFRERNKYFQDLGEPTTNCEIRLPPDRVYIPERMRTKFQNYLTKKSKINEKDVKILEKYVIEQGSYSKLNPELVRDLMNNNYRVNIDDINELFQKYGSFDSTLHDLLACYVASITFEGKFPGDLTPKQRERARDWITDIISIKHVYRSGVYLYPEINNSNRDLFFIKTQIPDISDLLYHDLLVGYFALNKLKKFIPNFVYTYGHFNCSRGFIDNDKFKSWCLLDDPNSYYIIYENIKDSLPMDKWMEEFAVPQEEFLSVFYQIVNALNLAYMKYGYIHYNLNLNNILIKGYKNKVIIPFYGPNGVVTKYISTKYVPYIINYRSNDIRLFDQRDEPIYFTSSNYGPSMTVDIFHLILQLKLQMDKIIDSIDFISNKLGVRTDNNDINNILISNMKFFKDNQGNPISLDYSTKGDNIIFSSHYNNNTINDFIKFSTSLPFKYDFVTDLDKINSKRIVKNVNKCNVSQLFSKLEYQNSLLEYCETLSSIKSINGLNEEQKKVMIEDVNNANNFFQLMLSGKELLASYFDDLKSFLDEDIIPPSLLGLNNISEATIEKYIIKLRNIYMLKGNTMKIFSLLNSIECSLNHFDEYLRSEGMEYLDEDYYQDNIDFVLENRRKAKEFLDRIETIKKIYVANNDYINSPKVKCNLTNNQCIKFITEHSYITNLL